jgi:hypothetical protein
MTRLHNLTHADARVRQGAVLLHVVAGLVILGLVGIGLLMLEFFSGNAEKKGDRDRFAADRDVPATPVPFDAKRAMGYLEDICKIGARISGTEGMKKQQELLEKHFKKYGGKITWQRFTARQRSVPKPVAMANLIVSYHPDRKRRVILCSHYDTRPIADQEPNRLRWHDVFLSANDGGSGVAVLMELAHHMEDLKTEVGVDFVFFDGEEFIYESRSVFNEGDKYFFGSEHFAREYAKVRSKTTYTGAILLDMVAGKGARFPKERNSARMAKALVEEVWGIAAELKCTAFSNGYSKVGVEDDHIGLNRIGRIPAIDIIDFDYPHWHRLTDVPRNCSGESMEQVAKVLSVWLQRAR